MDNQFEEKKIHKIQIKELAEDKEQPRKNFDPESLLKLKESISTYGLMQPIIFRQREPDKKLVIVAGERRFRAIKMIIEDAEKNPDNEQLQKLKEWFEEIPGLFIADKHQEISLIENVQREDLNPVELAEGVVKLKKEGEYTDEQLGAIIGKKKSTISELRSITKLPQKVLDEARKRNDVSQWVLVQAAQPDNPEEMIEKWNELKGRKLTQAEYRKEKKAAVPKDSQPKFNFGTCMRAVKTASTQMQSLGQGIGGLKDEKRQELQAELVSLKKELETALNSLEGTS